MGALEKESTGESLELPSRLIIGRSAHCDLRIDDARVSAEHASLYFEDDRWIVRDLASRNGTTVNGTELKSRDRRGLSRFARLCFGSSEQCWILVDDAPPADEGVDVTVQSSLELSRITLRFRVSPEEENVDLRLLHEGGELETPARAYHYLLVILARARQADRRDRISDQEQGWVHTETLVPRLYPDLETLNVNIHRARKLFAQLGVLDSKNLIERRGGSGEIRLGTPRIEIVGEAVEAPPA